MKSLPNFLIYFLFSFLFIGCSKDSDDCLFSGGKWCSDQFGINCLEFREIGEHYQSGAHSSDWKTKDDCKIIELYAVPLGIKILEYRVISINGNSTGSTMVLEQQAGIKQTFTKQ